MCASDQIDNIIEENIFLFKKYIILKMQPRLRMCVRVSIIKAKLHVNEPSPSWRYFTASSLVLRFNQID